MSINIDIPTWWLFRTFPQLGNAVSFLIGLWLILAPKTISKFAVRPPKNIGSATNRRLKISISDQKSSKEPEEEKTSVAEDEKQAKWGPLTIQAIGLFLVAVAVWQFLHHRYIIY